MQGFIFIQVSLEEVFLNHMKLCQFLFAYACAEFIFNGGNKKSIIDVDVTYSFSDFKKSLDVAAELGSLCNKQ